MSSTLISVEDVKPKIGARLRALCDEVDEDYHNLLTRPHNPDRPLLVVVHPGDITEVDGSREVREHSTAAQLALADLLDGWQGEVAILHRQSCVEFMDETGRAEWALTAALKQARKVAVQISYGDDLDDFVKDLEPAVTGRSSVTVAGAYRDPKHGCVDYVAKLLCQKCVQVKIDPSSYVAP